MMHGFDIHDPRARHLWKYSSVIAFGHMRRVREFPQIVHIPRTSVRVDPDATIWSDVQSYRYIQWIVSKASHVI